jgi:hypothetical protein
VIDDRSGDSIRLRIVFAGTPDEEPAVRRRIAGALASGDWTLLSEGPAELRPDETELTGRIGDQR